MIYTFLLLLYIIYNIYMCVCVCVCVCEREREEREREYYVLMIYTFQLIEQGTEKFTWKMKESSDFIESAMSLVCTDIFHSLKILQANCNVIMDITLSWNNTQMEYPLTQVPLSMEQLLEIKK